MDEREHAQAMRDQGATLKQIAATFGISVSTACRWVNPEAAENCRAASRRWKRETVLAFDGSEWAEADRGYLTPCWVWGGGLGDGGYGRASTGLAHRAVWRSLRGPIADGLQLDHLCRVRECVNPDHLEPVTGKENVRRSPIFKWSEERILDAIREWARLYGEPPASWEWSGENRRLPRATREEAARRFAAGDFPYLATVQRAFGSWGTAVEAAGFPRGRVGRRPRRQARDGVARAVCTSVA